MRGKLSDCSIPIEDSECEISLCVSASADGKGRQEFSRPVRQLAYSYQYEVAIGFE